MDGRRSKTLVTILGAIAIPTYLGIFTWYMQRSSYRVWGALLLAPLLILLPVPIVLRVARRDPDPRMVRLVIAALWLKLAGTALRYFVAFHVYGISDATGYDNEGARIAAAFRQGQFDVPFGHGGTGTRFLQFLTGWIYTVTGPNKIGAFLIFSWFSFIGLYLFYKAFRVAFPDGDHHRYALLLFFLPSLLYWPSSLGKEAWMTFGLGLCAYGAARMFARRRWAFLITGVGLWATAMVRPHVTLAVVVSLLGGYLLRRSNTGGALVAKLLGLSFVLVVTFFVLSRAEGFFGVDQLNADSAGSVLDNAQSRTGQGGSAFEGQRVRSPIDLPQAAVTVLFRPFPFEAHNVQTLIASLEGVILLAICASSLPRIRQLPRQLWRTPYLAFAATFTTVFIVAFSSLSNFGILARERVQVYPLLLALLCVPLATRANRADEEPAVPTTLSRFHLVGRSG